MVEDVGMDLLIGFVSGMVIFTVITLLSILPENDKKWEQNVIDRGYGQYCPTNGEFAFKGECN